MLHAAGGSSKDSRMQKRLEFQNQSPETKTSEYEETNLPSASALEHGNMESPHICSTASLERHGAQELGTESENSALKRSTKRMRTKSLANDEKDPDSTEKGHKRSYVEHRYHDHSHDDQANDKAMQQTAKSRGGITTPFPVQLHDMLQHADIRGYSDVVSWQPHGRAFLVHDQSRFVAEVMPMFFRQTRMSSFQRQLSLYGFLRLTRKGHDHGAYYHELFLRGRPHLCHRMQRTRIKGYWVRQSSSPESEPDFSTMSPVGPNAGDYASRAAAAAPTPPPQLVTGQISEPLAEGYDRSRSKVESSLIVGGLTSVAKDLEVPFHWRSMVRNDKIRIPLMPALELAAVASIDDDRKQPASQCRIRAQPMLDAFPIYQVQMPHNVQTQCNPGQLGLTHDKLEEHVMNMSATERDDMAAFLSDVDLTSGNEDSVDESFEEEAKIGRVTSPGSPNKRWRQSSI